MRKDCAGYVKRNLHGMCKDFAEKFMDEHKGVFKECTRNVQRMYMKLIIAQGCAEYVQKVCTECAMVQRGLLKIFRPSTVI